MWGGRVHLFYLSVKFVNLAPAKSDFLQFACYMDNAHPLLPKLLAIKGGDHEAFIEVYHALHAKIFRFLLKKVLLHDTAKELTQQSFIRLWQFRHTLSADHPLEKQIFIISRSLLINHFKKEATQKKVKAVHGRSQPTQVEPEGETMFERANEVNAAIQTLPPVRKRVIILKAFHGFSNKEIAVQLQISVKTVEDHVTKAFHHIRRVIAMLL